MMISQLPGRVEVKDSNYLDPILPALCTIVQRWPVSHQLDMELLQFVNIVAVADGRWVRLELTFMLSALADSI